MKTHVENRQLLMVPIAALVLWGLAGPLPAQTFSAPYHFDGNWDGVRLATG